jgi:hypothetical protein
MERLLHHRRYARESLGVNHELECVGQSEKELECVGQSEKNISCAGQNDSLGLPSLLLKLD